MVKKPLLLSLLFLSDSTIFASPVASRLSGTMTRRLGAQYHWQRLCALPSFNDTKRNQTPGAREFVGMPAPCQRPRIVEFPISQAYGTGTQAAIGRQKQSLVKKFTEPIQSTFGLTTGLASAYAQLLVSEIYDHDLEHSDFNNAQDLIQTWVRKKIVQDLAYKISKTNNGSPWLDYNLGGKLIGIQAQEIVDAMVELDILQGILCEKDYVEHFRNLSEKGEYIYESYPGYFYYVNLEYEREGPIIVSFKDLNSAAYFWVEKILRLNYFLNPRSLSFGSARGLS